MSTKPLNINDIERDLIKTALTFMARRCEIAEGSSSAPPAPALKAASQFTRRRINDLLAKVAALDAKESA